MTKREICIDDPTATLQVTGRGEKCGQRRGPAIFFDNSIAAHPMDTPDGDIKAVLECEEYRRGVLGSITSDGEDNDT
jgi:hypothetical protein